MKKYNNVSNYRSAIINYAKNNSKEYILVILIFVIGLFLGIMFINNCSEENASSISSYISEFIEKFKNSQNLDKTNIYFSSIKNNIILALIIWVAGTTIIGIPIVFGLILFRGFCLGYTISAITYTLGFGKGLLFCIISLFLQNIFFIPAILTMGVSSIKLYRSIIADRRRENIKIEIIRHTIISLLMLGMLMVSSFIECEISLELLKFGINIF